MEKETKVAAAPVETKTAEDESIIDNRRQELEKIVITENERVPELPLDDSSLEPQEGKLKEETKPDVKSEIDPYDKIKKSVQKRIDKVVAQKKSVEDELSEAKAEIERLKSSKPNGSVPEKSEPPTPEQVEAYILKMREDGNAKEEISATRYLIKLEKEMALKEVEDRQEKVQKEAEVQKSKQLSDWASLNRDYIAYDESGKVDKKSDLNLSNQNGLLYKTALGLYNDKELHADFYDNPDVIQGFRRAVADAYREIHQQGFVKSPKGETILEKRTPRVSLGEPSSVEAEEETTQVNLNSLSDAEKVREEIKSRKKSRFIR